ncbi:MAG: DUF4089 domain-containing protein [Magnetovibrionaceae bacterium]
MTKWQSDQDVEAYIDAASKALDLPVDEPHRPGVIQFLKLAAEMAETLDRAPIAPFEAELAPVFRLPEPDQ